MRLDKFLSHTGFGSRKDVKVLLKSGQVCVNGNIEKNGQFFISEETDTVCVNEEIIHYQKFCYYLLNKPKGVISATQDNQHKTVLDLFNKSDIKKNLFPVGRLDKDTTGLLLVTNDGALAHNLLSPKKKIPKIYQAIVLGIMDEKDILAFKEGVEIDGGEVCLPAKLRIESVDTEKNQSSIQLEIYEGKYHQVKRMVKAVGKRVIELNRLSMGGLTLDDMLKKGEYRELSQEEISLIKNGYKKRLKSDMMAIDNQNNGGIKMVINWKKEVEERREDLLKDLFSLLSIPSVRDDSKASQDAPVGPGPKEALLAFLEIGQRDGFITKNVDNYAGHIEYGTGDETLGVFGHVDVVPVGSGWDSDPFKPEIRDGKLYARGASDDKGPTMAAYYALKIIKELKLPVSKRTRIIIGTDEESEWKCMQHYLEVEEIPDFGFSPDAEFPMINGEKGNVTVLLEFAGKNEGMLKLISFEAGQRPNMVPDLAEAVVKISCDTSAFREEFEEYLLNTPVSGEISLVEDIATIKIYGKAAHGAMPEKGINAGTYLANFLSDYDFSGPAKDFLTVTSDFIHLDTKGESFNVNHIDDIMGELSMNAGIFEFSDTSNQNTITLNFRYPKGITADDIAKRLEEKIKHTSAKVILGNSEKPHYLSPEDPLVQTLLAVYEDHTGLKGHEKVIGGGTFGRLLERGVAYGAMFPDSIDTMHQKNEFISVDDLINATIIYADAIYRLIK